MLYLKFYNMEGDLQTNDSITALFTKVYQFRKQQGIVILEETDVFHVCLYKKQVQVQVKSSKSYPKS